MAAIQAAGNLTTHHQQLGLAACALVQSCLLHQWGQAVGFASSLL